MIDIDMNDIIKKGLGVLSKEISVKCVDVNDKENENYILSIYKFILMLQSIPIEKFEIILKQIKK